MSEKKILAAAVKSSGEYAVAKMIWVRYPLLERIATAFAKYVGLDAVDENGAPLLVTALKRALEEVSRHEDDDDLARAAFVNALLDHSIDVFGQLAVVETPSGEIQWMPFASSLPDFAGKYPDSPLKVARKVPTLTAEMARLFIIMKILPSSLLDEESLKEFLNPVAQVA